MKTEDAIMCSQAATIGEVLHCRYPRLIQAMCRSGLEASAAIEALVEYQVFGMTTEAFSCVSHLGGPLAAIRQGIRHRHSPLRKHKG